MLNQDAVQSENLAIVEMLGQIYEDLDIENVEEKFIDLVQKVFSFDRLALFFVKHKKEVLQGKLPFGFAPELIEGREIPLMDGNIFAKSLVNGLPSIKETRLTEPWIRDLGLENFALIPIINKKNVPCWQMKKCLNLECPAHGKNWLRCWMMTDTLCADGLEPLSAGEKKERCRQCPVYTGHDFEVLEGVLLVDNSVSGRPIKAETITALSVIAHAVGGAINNSKIYRRTLNNAIKDELTGLHNRRYFNERLLDEVERARRYDDSLSLILCDIDNFKKINDIYGHPIGDDVLLRVAGLLRANRRKSDVTARYGGEEFVLILLNTGKEKAMEVADDIRSRIMAAIFNADPQEFSLTASFGVATLGVDANTFEGLIAKADKYLYNAKARGKNLVCGD